jgi:hypothetical protein
MLYDPRWNKLIGWRKVLWEAADVIEREGWIQRKYHTKKGYCIAGAIGQVRAPRSSRLLAERKLDEALDDILEAWNDRRGRSKSEVVAKGLVRGNDRSAASISIGRRC